MSDLFALQSPDAPLTGPHAASDDAEPLKYLAVFLHGYGSDERDLAGLGEYLPPGLPWVSVRAPQRHPSFGYSWYPLEVDFSPASSIAESTDALWAWADANVDARTLLIPIGFSQGAMMASQLLRTRPERIGATVALSGYVSDVPRPADARLAQSPPRLFWGRGDQDDVISGSLVGLAGEWFAKHTAVQAHVYPGMGHSISAEELADIRRFLDATLI